MKLVNPNRAVFILALCLAAQVGTVAAKSVEKKGEWSERYALTTEVPTLEIHNIWGDVRVLPGPEGEITLKAVEHRSAPSQELFDRSLEVYGLDIQADEESVAVFVGSHRQSWHRNDPCRRCRVDYQFEVHVPPNTRVFASTVNDGRVEVSDIRGPINADNVNGPVTILNASACGSVESINGKVRLSFRVPPGSDCAIDTINGDIHLQVPDNSGLDIALDLGNGRMTSELPVDPVAIPARVEHRETGGGHQYRIEQAAGIRLAGGGPVFSVKSMNGDFRIQKTN